MDIAAWLRGLGMERYAAAFRDNESIGRCCLADLKEPLIDNRRMTDAAHNQHSETRRPSDRDRLVTTGPSRSPSSKISRRSTSVAGRSERIASSRLARSYSFRSNADTRLQRDPSGNLHNTDTGRDRASDENGALGAMSLPSSLVRGTS